MKLFRRSQRRDQPPPAPEAGQRAEGEAAEGSNATQRRPDPKAEPIPDGVHKHVPRSPYRTGNW